MGRLKSMQAKVEYLLKIYPITRDSDKMLICAVYSRYYNVDMSDSFGKVMSSERLPSFETIRRCRQKAQAEHEELRGRRDRERLERQKEYVEYATEGK